MELFHSWKTCGAGGGRSFAGDQWPYCGGWQAAGRFQGAQKRWQHGVRVLGGARPFVLHPDGAGWLHVPSGLKDGPLPTHYEPLESLLGNPLYAQGPNPAAQKKERPDNYYANSPGDARFPYVLTTYRLTEHHTAGGMTRTLSHLAELQPELFTEVSPQLAEEA